MVRIQKHNHQNYCSSNKATTILLMIIALPTTALIASWALGSWLPLAEMNISPRGGAVDDPLLVVQPPACEGYWPETDVCVKLGQNPSKSMLTKENAGCPQWRIRAWDNQATVTEKLRAIEAVAKEWETLLQDITGRQLERAGGVEGVTPPVFISRQRGLAWSRIEEGVMAGNAEYHTGGDDDVCWTDAMLPLYIEKYLVEPSDKFQQFVLDFDVDGFRDALAKLKTRMGPP